MNLVIAKKNECKCIMCTAPTTPVECVRVESGQNEGFRLIEKIYMPRGKKVNIIQKTGSKIDN